MKDWKREEMKDQIMNKIWQLKLSNKEAIDVLDHMDCLKFNSKQYEFLYFLDNILKYKKRKLL